MMESRECSNLRGVDSFPNLPNDNDLQGKDGHVSDVTNLAAIVRESILLSNSDTASDLSSKLKNRDIAVKNAQMSASDADCECLSNSICNLLQETRNELIVNFDSFSYSSTSKRPNCEKEKSSRSSTPSFTLINLDDYEEKDLRLSYDLDKFSDIPNFTSCPFSPTSVTAKTEGNRTPEQEVDDLLSFCDSGYNSYNAPNSNRTRFTDRSTFSPETNRNCPSSFETSFENFDSDLSNDISDEDLRKELSSQDEDALLNMDLDLNNSLTKSVLLEKSGKKLYKPMKMFTGLRTTRSASIRDDGSNVNGCSTGEKGLSPTGFEDPVDSVPYKDPGIFSISSTSVSAAEVPAVVSYVSSPCRDVVNYVSSVNLTVPIAASGDVSSKKIWSHDASTKTSNEYCDKISHGLNMKVGYFEEPLNFTSPKNPGGKVFRSLKENDCDDSGSSAEKLTISLDHFKIAIIKEKDYSKYVSSSSIITLPTVSCNVSDFKCTSHVNSETSIINNISKIIPKPNTSCGKDCEDSITVQTTATALSNSSEKSGSQNSTEVNLSKVNNHKAIKCSLRTVRKPSKIITGKVQSNDFKTSGNLHVNFLTDSYDATVKSKITAPDSCSNIFRDKGIIFCSSNSSIVESPKNSTTELGRNDHLQEEMHKTPSEVDTIKNCSSEEISNPAKTLDERLAISRKNNDVKSHSSNKNFSDETTSPAVPDSNTTTDVTNNKPLPKLKLSMAEYLERASSKLVTDSDTPTNAAGNNSSTDSCSSCSGSSSCSSAYNDNISGKNRNDGSRESCSSVTPSHSLLNSEILTDTSFEKVISNASNTLLSTFSSKFLGNVHIPDKLIFGVPNRESPKDLSDEGNISNNYGTSCVGIVSSHKMVPVQSRADSGVSEPLSNNNAIPYKRPSSSPLKKSNVAPPLKVIIKIPRKMQEKRKMRRRWTLKKIDFEKSQEERLSNEFCRLRFRSWNNGSFVNKLTFRLKTSFSEIADFTLPQITYGLPDYERSFNVIYAKIMARVDKVFALKLLAKLKNYVPQLLGLDGPESKNCVRIINNVNKNLVQISTSLLNSPPSQRSGADMPDKKSPINRSDENPLNLIESLPKKYDSKLKSDVPDEKSLSKTCSQDNASNLIKNFFKNCDSAVKSRLPEKLEFGVPVFPKVENENLEFGVPDCAKVQIEKLVFGIPDCAKVKDNQIENKSFSNSNDHIAAESGLCLQPSKSLKKESNINGYLLNLNSVNRKLHEALNSCTLALKRKCEMLRDEPKAKHFKADSGRQDDSVTDDLSGMPCNKPDDTSSLKSKCIKMTSSLNISQTPKPTCVVTLDESSSEDSDDDSVISLTTSDILLDNNETVDMDIDNETTVIDFDCETVESDILRSPINCDVKDLSNCIEGLEPNEYYRRRCNPAEQLINPESMTDIESKITNLCEPTKRKDPCKPKSDNRPVRFSPQCESTLLQIEKAEESKCLASHSRVEINSKPSDGDQSKNFERIQCQLRVDNYIYPHNTASHRCSPSRSRECLFKHRLSAPHDRAQTRQKYSPQYSKISAASKSNHCTSVPTKSSGSVSFTQLVPSHEEDKNCLFSANTPHKAPLMGSDSPDFQAYQSILPRYDNFNQYQSYLSSTSTDQSVHPIPSFPNPGIKSPDFQSYQSLFSRDLSFNQYQSYLPSNDLNQAALCTSFDIEPAEKSDFSDSFYEKDSSYLRSSSDWHYADRINDSSASQNLKSATDCSFAEKSSLVVPKCHSEGPANSSNLTTASQIGNFPNVFGQPSCLSRSIIDNQIDKHTSATLCNVDTEASNHNVANITSKNCEAKMDLPPVEDYAPLPLNEISCSKIPRSVNEISPSKIPLAVNEVSIPLAVNEVTCSKIPPPVNEVFSSKKKIPLPENEISTPSAGEEEKSTGKSKWTYQNGFGITAERENEIEILPGSNSEIKKNNGIGIQVDNKNLEVEKGMSIWSLLPAETESPEAAETEYKFSSVDDVDIKEAERKDHLDPGWNFWKKLTTYEEKYSAIRRAWSNLCVSNPKVNLTVRNFQKRNSFAPRLAAPAFQRNNANDEMPTIPYDRVFVEQVYQNMQQLKETVDSLQDAMENKLHMITMNYQNKLRNIQNPAFLPEIEESYFMAMNGTRNFFEKRRDNTITAMNTKNLRLRSVAQEVVKFHQFYNDLDGQIPEYSLRVTNEEYEETVEINQMLEHYNNFYK